MNKPVSITTGYSACPHDCPSTCSLDVEVIEGSRIGRLRGAAGNDYTAGVICAKVARYAERVDHPDRLTHALKRKGARGSGEWQQLPVAAALDEIAEAFDKAEARHGAQTVWPYFYAGTMGLVQRDGINRLRHVKGYSGQFDTICTNMAWTGFVAGTGKLAGPDPREMARSDLVIIWGTNAAATQVNVMTHAVRARKSRGARIVVIDVYNNATMAQADLALCGVRSFRWASSSPGRSVNVSRKSRSAWPSRNRTCMTAQASAPSVPGRRHSARSACAMVAL